MRRRSATRSGALVAALLGVLVFAPTALGGTVGYTIQESPSYSIQDNGNGIVKVTYSGCVTAGVRQTLAFKMVTNVSGDANATFTVLKEEGAAPVTSFNPASVFLAKGAQQSFDVALSFTLDDANNGITAFRIKLDPESGEGLGQGPGIMVKIPCVIPAGAAFPVPQRQGAAPCVTVQQLRLRAGERSTIRVRVRANGQNIARSLVRLRGAGLSERARTGSDGIARFRVRPRRAGTLFIQTTTCSGADRLSVRGARRSASRALPRNTG